MRITRRVSPRHERTLNLGLYPPAFRCSRTMSPDVPFRHHPAAGTRPSQPSMLHPTTQRHAFVPYRLSLHGLHQKFPCLIALSNPLQPVTMYGSVALLRPSYTSDSPNGVAGGLQRLVQTVRFQESLKSVSAQTQLAMPTKPGHSHAALRRQEEPRADVVWVAIFGHKLSSTSLLGVMPAPLTGNLIKPCLGGRPHRYLCFQRRVLLGQRRISLSQFHRYMLKLLPKQIFLLLHRSTPSASSGSGNQRQLCLHNARCKT